MVAPNKHTANWSRATKLSNAAGLCRPTTHPRHGPVHNFGLFGRICGWVTSKIRTHASDIVCNSHGKGDLFRVTGKLEGKIWEGWPVARRSSSATYYPTKDSGRVFLLQTGSHSIFSIFKSWKFLMWAKRKCSVCHSGFKSGKNIDHRLFGQLDEGTGGAHG